MAAEAKPVQVQQKPVLQKPPGYREPNMPVQRPLPPRKPKLPPSFHREKRRKCSCSCCSCCFYLVIVIFVLIIIAAAAAGIFYLWFQPKLPLFHIKSFQFPKFNITDSSEGPLLNLQSAVSVDITNPNKELSMIYGKTQVLLKNKDGELGFGTANLPAFTQERKNATVLKFTTQVKNLLIDEKTSEKLKSGFRSKRLAVSMEVRTGVGIGGKGWRTETLNVKVICEALNLKQSRSGATPKCRINIFKWINL